MKYRYEKSFMHRDVVTHVAVSVAGFFITGSIDGTLLCYTYVERDYFKIFKKAKLAYETQKCFNYDII